MSTSRPHHLLPAQVKQMVGTDRNMDRTSNSTHGTLNRNPLSHLQCARKCSQTQLVVETFARNALVRFLSHARLLPHAHWWQAKAHIAALVRSSPQRHTARLRI